MAKVKRKVNRNLYACKYCVSDFHRLADYRRHMRVHKSLLPNSPAKPPNALLSRKSDGEGVFDFDGVLQREEEFSPASPGSNAERSDVDSYYSDAELNNISYGNNNDDESVDTDPHNEDNGNFGDDDNSSDESDSSDGSYTYHLTLTIAKTVSSTISKMMS